MKFSFHAQNKSGIYKRAIRLFELKDADRYLWSHHFLLDTIAKT